MSESTASERGAGEVLGKVASPPHRESTCDEFYFWARPDVVVEKTQIVRVDCPLGGRVVQFYGLVNEVYRQGRQSSIAEGYDRHDGDTDYVPPFVVPGVTFASATILRTEPSVLAPPVEGCDVVLGGEEEARVAYAAEEIEEEDRLAVGVIKNGGSRLAGPGAIDLAYLLGENGGHLNVNGVAGRGTKSSFLLHMMYVLGRTAERLAAERPSDPERLKVVPIILNVKNYDLFFIDRASKKFRPERDLPDWRALGIDDPRPFSRVEFFAPQERRSANPVDVGRADVMPYSWGLADVVREGLFRYLFADDDIADDNFEGVVLDIERRLTREDRRGDAVRLSLDDQGGAVRTFGQLAKWVDVLIDGEAEGDEEEASDRKKPAVKGRPLRKHHVGTLRKFQRRLAKIVHEGDGVLRRDDASGHPLDVRSADTRAPRVVDIHGLARTPGLQRFVVASIFRQLVEDRTGGRTVPGLRYLVMLDELNRFAPRGARDPITRLIETVAAEMRSQGIILLGAQQQASLVSTRVFENAGIKALGRSGSMEMNRDVWKSLPESARRKAAALDVTEKLLVQDSFRVPMLVRIPMPPWALNRHEALDAPAGARVRDEFDL